MQASDASPESQEHIDARGSQGFIYKPTGPVEQVFIEAEKAYDVRGLPNPYLGCAPSPMLTAKPIAGREALVEEALARLTDPAIPKACSSSPATAAAANPPLPRPGLLPALEAALPETPQSRSPGGLPPGIEPLATLADALSQLGLQFDCPLAQ